MKNDRNVKHHTSFLIAFIVSGADVISGQVIMIGDFAVFWISRIERTILFLTNATYCRIAVSLLLFPT